MSLAQRISRARPFPPEKAIEPRPLSFDELYQRHAAFTWRALRHLGVQAHAVDDAVQELWVVVHRPSRTSRHARA